MRFAKVFLSFGVIVFCILLISGTGRAVQKYVAKTMYDSSPELRVAVSRASEILRSGDPAEQKQAIAGYRVHMEKIDQAYSVIFMGEMAAYVVLALAAALIYLRLNPKPRE